MTDVIRALPKRHPSYGVVRVSRTGGLTSRLAGTVQGVHSSAVELVFHEGQRRDYADGKDFWTPIGAPLMGVRMSMLQWAELISSFGTGGTSRAPLRLLEESHESHLRRTTAR